MIFHNLQDPEHKKNIIPDAAMLKLFTPDPSKPVTFFNIQTYIKDHFLPNPNKGVAVEASAAPVATA
jgi:chromatin remodeling complex protein RSC6